MNKKTIIAAVVSIIIFIVIVVVTVKYAQDDFRISDEELNDASQILQQKLEEKIRLKNQNNLRPSDDKKPHIPQKLLTFTTIDEALQSIKQIIDCYAKETCGPTEERDPKHRTFALSSDLRLVLSKVDALIAGNNQTELKKLLLYLKDHDDDWVKDQLLNYFQKMPVNAENFSLMTEIVIGSDDPSLFQKALQYTQQIYKPQEYNRQIVTLFEKSLQSDKYYAPIYMAQQLPRFLSAENVDGFKRILNKLPKTSTKYRLMHKALADFKN